MDWRHTVGTKTPGRYREVTINGCLTVLDELILTSFREARRRYTSAMSATHNSLVTEDNNVLAALTIVPLLADAQGSSANSLAPVRIESPERQHR